MPTNGWDEWSQHILRELERLNTCMIEIDNKLDLSDKSLSIEIAKLKTKAGTWGLLGGLIPVLVSLGIGILLWSIKG